MKVSVIVPTFDRGARLAVTVNSLLRSTLSGIAGVELIVVDDGSTPPASLALEQCKTEPLFALRCIRQVNAGPAAARNSGFRVARGEIVIFVDDDILCPPELIRLHVAAHAARPGSVICGRCLLVEPQPVTPLFRFMNSQGNDPGEGASDEFISMNTVASGQISIERSMFDSEHGVYRDDLATPAAEEFELATRLRTRRIPIFLATRIIAFHDHPVVIDGICHQQYKHAFGCAEAALKYPATLDLPELANVINAVKGSGRRESVGMWLKRAVRRLLAVYPLRAALLGVVRVAERLALHPRALAPLYRAVIGLHFFAGVIQGMEKYSQTEARPPC